MSSQLTRLMTLGIGVLLMIGALSLALKMNQGLGSIHLSWHDSQVRLVSDHPVEEVLYRPGYIFLQQSSFEVTKSQEDYFDNPRVRKDLVVTVEGVVLPLARTDEDREDLGDFLKSQSQAYHVQRHASIEGLVTGVTYTKP